MIPTPLIQYKFMRKNSQFNIWIKDIYKFVHIFSKYNCRKNPTREKIPKLFPLHSTTNYHLESHHLRIMIMILIISKVNSKINFQSGFILNTHEFVLRYFKLKWSKPTIPILTVPIYKLNSFLTFKIDLNLLNFLKLKNWCELKNLNPIENTY